MQAFVQHPSTRRRFLAMTTTYFLGVFNDNFFKQAGLLLAVAAGLSGLQAWATMLFSLPFILFSAWAGWLADQFVKKQVIIAVKVLELIAMLLGAYGIIALNWNCILAMLFLMGLQSTLFGPALNGSIPELFAADQVTRVNSVLKLVTTLAILLGMALAGPVLDLELLLGRGGIGRLVVAGVVVAVALGGVVAACGVHGQPAQGRQMPFPWSGPLASIRDLFTLRADRLLALAVLCDCFFYFISLLAVSQINTLGLQQLALSKSHTSLLSVSLMVGICVGAFAASRWTTIDRWTHVLRPAGLGMGGCLLLVGLLVHLGWASYWSLLLLLVAAGSCGGLLLIPVTSYIQVRPAPGIKGRVIAAANFLAFCGMCLSGGVFFCLDAWCTPASGLMVVGGATCLLALSIGLRSWIRNQ